MLAFPARASLALLLLTVGALRADEPNVTPTKDRSFRIPFQLHNEERELREVRLYYSTDQGRTWQLHATAAPNDRWFQQFDAPTDGLYWFAVRTVDRAGRLYPQDDEKLRPGLKVLVDTLSPTLILRPYLPGKGPIGLDWTIRDENLDLRSLRLEYRPTGSESWKPLPIDAVAAGHGSWPLESESGWVDFRMTVADVAGNQATDEVPMPLRRDAPIPPPDCRPPKQIVVPGIDPLNPPPPRRIEQKSKKAKIILSLDKKEFSTPMLKVNLAVPLPSGPSKCLEKWWTRINALSPPLGAASSDSSPGSPK